MKKKRRLTASLAALLLTGLTLHAAEAINKPATDTVAPALSLTISCTNSGVKVGNEISITFIIANHGSKVCRYSDAHFGHLCGMFGYDLVAKTAAGEVVSGAPHLGLSYSDGPLPFATLRPGESFTNVFPLNVRALIKNSGRYEVVGTCKVSIPQPGHEGWPWDLPAEPLVSDPISITVQPRTSQEMDAYISDLTKQIAALPPNSDYHGQIGSTSPLDDLVMKLMFTCNPKIVPTFLTTMYKSDHDNFWEFEGLLFYVPHSEETRKAIITTVNTRGLPPNMESQFFQDMPTNMMGFSFFHQYGFTKEEMKPLIERLLGKNNPEDWSAGVELAAQYGDDAFTARLIAIATTPGINARLTAISALAYNRTDDGVKTLKTLLNDPDPKIWWPLGAAIQNGYYRGIQPAGRPLRPEDFTAKDLEPLIERLMNDTNHDPVLGISLAAEFSDDDTFTQRLIGIAKTRGNTGRVNAIYALALNRTAEGLKTLNELLNDPDPEIRTMTENAIRYAYTSHGNSRGRPLKPEDFDAKYRQPEPGKSNL